MLPHIAHIENNVFHTDRILGNGRRVRPPYLFQNQTLNSLFKAKMKQINTKTPRNNYQMLKNTLAVQNLH